MKKVFILGAGPAGLAVLDGLSHDPDIKPVLIEASDQVGGLAQTLPWGSYGHHDLGPHKLFTLDAALEARVRSLLPSSDWLVRPKISRIYIAGHFLPYPPSPVSFLKVYGIKEFAGMGINYLTAKITPSKTTNGQQTFESDLSSRVGNKLYGRLFKPIATKLWGDPAEIDAKLSKSRVQTPSLLQLLAKSIGISSATQSSEALEFFYPKSGLQKLWNAILSKSSKADIQTRTRISGFEIKNNRIHEIIVEKKDEAPHQTRIAVQADDWVVSTMPLAQTAGFLKNQLPSDTLSLVNQFVRLNDLILVFLKINKPRLMPDAWVFVPDAGSPFHRISEQAAFDPSMTPNGSIVCCEIMSYKNRPFYDKTDSELRELCIKGLTAMGFDTADSEKWDSKVIRLPKSYPVYQVGYEPALKKIISGMDALENFKSIGRQGSFNYIGSLDAMNVGYGFSSWFLNEAMSERSNHAWKNERERTAHFPVLD